MKLNISKLLLACGMSAAVILPSCSLDEENPGGFTLQNIATSPEGYETVLNNCYFGMERLFYNAIDFQGLMEGNTDLWTVALNDDGKNDMIFKFFKDASPDRTFTNALWNAAYDGIGACCLAIETAPNVSFTSETTRSQKVAEAHFLRAMYYYNIVEMFGGVVKLNSVTTSTNYSPDRTEPIEIYRDIILPDLRFAVENLTVGTYATDGVPTKKSALGFLAKACLATQQYGTTEFLQEGYDAAKKLITDCENGGNTYLAYMYPDFDDVFKEANNKVNKEALWKYSVYSGSDGHGSSNGNYRNNRNDEHFLCQVNHIGARTQTQETLLAWDGGIIGDFMPTNHLLNLYVQADGSLDPRFHKLFLTEWNSNVDYVWTDGDATRYDKAASLVGTKLPAGNKCIKFVMPQDAEYAAEVAAKATSPYVLIEYKDVYNEHDSITMKKGEGENHYRYFYPSLNKHCSSNYFVANASKNRNGNLNAVLVMRMAEVYLMAAEYDILLNGGTSAMGYINKVRNRAGAKALTGTATIRTVIDERGRELCGEFTRFFDLKRTGMYKDATYLKETHPTLAKYFKPEYALRPIPQAYIDVITTGSLFVNPGY